MSNYCFRVVFIISPLFVGCTGNGTNSTLGEGDAEATDGPDDSSRGDASTGGGSGNHDPTGATSAASTTAPEADGSTFIVVVETGDMPECDVWAQDCPDGEKCMPWANNGGSAWNALKCAPLDDVPDSVGDPCTVEGNGVSGLDSCDVGAICWNPDENNEGVCIEFCHGSAANPSCTDSAHTSCSILNDGVLIVCLPNCDPLAVDECPDGQVCYPTSSGFGCAPHGGDTPYGTPCEFLNACNAGTFCDSPANVPSCSGGLGCCNEYCDVTAGEGQCQAPGAVCAPWYADSPPPGYEDLGGCVIQQ